MTTRALFLYTDEAGFWSHRACLARAAQGAGAEVYAMIQRTQPNDETRNAGLRLIDWRHLSRRSLNPIREFMTLVEVIRVYRNVRPNLVHHFTLKPVIYGGIAAALCDVEATVSTIAGLGSLFSRTDLKSRVACRLVKSLLGFVLNRRNSITIFQTSEDREALVKAGVLPMEKTRLVRGSGVNPEQYIPRPEPEGLPTVIYASRLLWSKGVGDFVDACRLLNRRGVNARFVVVGDPDPGNPDSIDLAEVEGWARDGSVEWWGRSTDMPGTFAHSNVFCYPTYYKEGVPRVLIEASSCARAVVSTDIPGVHDIVQHGITGLLIPARDVEALAEALQVLINSRELRIKMGRAGRQRVISDFSEQIVVSRVTDIYRELLGRRWPPNSDQLATQSRADPRPLPKAEVFK